MYQAEPDPALDNRSAFWPRGKVLGGSSSINAMVYVRGQPADFDDWRAAGNPGWSFSELLPYFRKLEDHAWGLSEFHGAAGPVHVSDVSGSVHPLCTSFLEACTSVGISATRDFNGAQAEDTKEMPAFNQKGIDEQRAKALIAHMKSLRE